MHRYRPTELKEYLRKLEALPKRGLSQNFLIDGNILDKIVELADVQSSDLAVEIGPGPGALTEKLLQAGCRVMAIEIDAAFAKALQELNHPQLTVVCADALQFDFEGALRAESKKAKVVANLPYHLTTPIIQRLLPLSDYLESATLMVQEEAARRFLQAEGAFSLFLHYYSIPEYGFKVSPKCFYPVPKVHSAVIRLNLHKRYPVVDEKAFFHLINSAFSQKRKTLKATLRHLPIEQTLVLMGKEPDLRPEVLTLAEWVTLFQLLDLCGKARDIH